MSFATFYSQLLLRSSSTSPRADEALRDYIAVIEAALKSYLR